MTETLNPYPKYSPSWWEWERQVGRTHESTSSSADPPAERVQFTEQRQGNEPTYSGNGKGNHDAAVIEQCAWLAYEQLKAYPGTNGDAVFVLCLDENGVWAI